MIRRLNESDRDQTVDLLAASPHLNLYLLGNVAANGFEEDFCEFWGDEYGGRLRGVVNRYMTGWSVFGQAEADWAGLASVVDMHPVVGERLQDNPGGVRSLLPFMRCYHATHVSEETLMTLDAGDFRPQNSVAAGITVRRATLEDLPSLVAFYRDAGEHGAYAVWSRTAAARSPRLACGTRQRSVGVGIDECRNRDPCDDRGRVYAPSAARTWAGACRGQRAVCGVTHRRVLSCALL